MTDPVPGELRRDPAGEGTEVVMGIDIGGSSTRAVAIDRNGVAGPIGRSPGGNPSTRRADEIAAAVGSAIDAALAGWHRPSVVAIVVGLAGLDESRRSELEGTIRTAARSHGIDVEPLLRTDAEIAFAAGSLSPAGLVVIAGTGAIAARIRNRREVATVDGHGWRLGDAGSGYWLGAEVLRRVLEALDGRRPPTAMTAAVLDHIATRAHSHEPEVEPSGDTDDPRWRIIRATLHLHPSDIAAFAVTTRVVRASALAARGDKADLVLAICRELEATTYLSGRTGATYLDAAVFADHGISIDVQCYQPAPYPRVHPVANEDARGLSALDVWAHLGGATADYLREAP